MSYRIINGQVYAVNNYGVTTTQKKIHQNPPQRKTILVHQRRAKTTKQQRVILKNMKIFIFFILKMVEYQMQEIWVLKKPEESM